MGTMTINVEDKTEKEFRKLAGAKYGRTKGYLGAATGEALQLWAEKEKKQNISMALDLLEKGVEMGKLNYRNRAELHER